MTATASGSGWEQPKELSADDKMAEYLNKTPPARSTALVIAAVLVNLQFNPKLQEQVSQNGKETYIELLRNLLTGLRHASELDAASFLLEHLTKLTEKHGDKLPVEAILYILAQTAEMAREASLKSLTVAHNLSGLYDCTDENSK